MSNLTNEQVIGAINVGLRTLSGLADNIIFSAAFSYHTTNNVDFDEAIEHVLDCLMKTKKRIPEYIKEHSK